MDKGFNYFASTLVGLRKELKRVLAFGSDGDKALVIAPSHNFPFALDFRCSLHFKKNVEHKLKELEIPTQEFLSNIFGRCVSNTYQEGLVDSCSVQQFNERLNTLKPLWDAKEKPSATPSGPRFLATLFSIKLTWFDTI